MNSNLPLSKRDKNLLKGWSLRRAGPVFSAIVVQVALLVITLFIVVMVPQSKPEPEFVAHRTVYLPQKELDHRVAQAAFEQVASPPMLMEKIQVNALSPDSLPELPSLPESSFNPMLATEMLPPAAALEGAAGMASLAGTFPGDASSLSFFGIQDSGTRMVIAFDVSKSVMDAAARAGVPPARIREETRELIDGLGPNTRFGVVQFIRRFSLFEERMLPASRSNKDRALQWLDSEFHTTGFSPSQWQRLEAANGRSAMDGIQAVLRVVAEWEPDVLFIISDGGFGRNVPSRMQRIDLSELERDIETIRRETGHVMRIHFIGFEVRADREPALRRIVSRSGGSYRVF